MKRASIAIELHQIAAARFDQVGTDSAHQEVIDALNRLATAPTTMAGCAAVAAYVAILPPGDLPDGWLPVFAGVIARIRQRHVASG